jgi:hypothetical protein
VLQYITHLKRHPIYRLGSYGPVCALKISFEFLHSVIFLYLDNLGESLIVSWGLCCQIGILVEQKIAIRSYAESNRCPIDMPPKSISQIRIFNLCSILN